MTASDIPRVGPADWLGRYVASCRLRLGLDRTSAAALVPLVSPRDVENYERRGPPESARNVLAYAVAVHAPGLGFLGRLALGGAERNCPEIGSALASRRRAVRLTQDEVVAALPIALSHGHVARIDAGEIALSAQKYLRYVDRLGADLRVIAELACVEPDRAPRSGPADVGEALAFMLPFARTGRLDRVLGVALPSLGVAARTGDRAGHVKLLLALSIAFGADARWYGAEWLLRLAAPRADEGVAPRGRRRTANRTADSRRSGPGEAADAVVRGVDEGLDWMIATHAAFLCMQRGDTLRAARHLDRLAISGAAAASRGAAQLGHDLGCLRARQGRFDAARGHLQDAVRAAPNEEFVVASIAEIALLESARRDRRAVERALETAADHLDSCDPAVATVRKVQFARAARRVGASRAARSLAGEAREEAAAQGHRRALFASLLELRELAVETRAFLHVDALDALAHRAGTGIHLPEPQRATYSRIAARLPMPPRGGRSRRVQEPAPFGPRRES